ncbi:hypothetical protein CHS0354_017729 [Potamilus streckersoni]|uniref:Uncharacterized protein n=1 Tax=Potamilus streckersoni TaxID=2493646 RepID=A0AAE0SI72_9BIVA|nr:hypothetical protein CHS0354_017729 [Potamilus streckersoni]
MQAHAQCATNSMSRSSLLSILLNLKQEAQSLLDTTKNTYDHILHSVIVNDLKKRREAVKEGHYLFRSFIDLNNGTYND